MRELRRDARRLTGPVRPRVHPSLAVVRTSVLALLGAVGLAGCVVLPGLDSWLDEAAWQVLPPGHPQHGLKRLLDRIGVGREAVALWPACAGEAGNPARARLLSEAMRPAETTEAWREAAADLAAVAAEATLGLSRIDAPTPREEAGAIALILREALLGVDRFDGFLDRLGISRATLAARLALMVEAGVLERVPPQAKYARYRLTDAGRALAPVIEAVRDWGDVWLPLPAP